MSNEGVTAVERAMAILDCFRLDADRLSLADFSARLPLHKTTIYRLLNSLVRTRYVVRHADGRYSLGPRVLYLGRVCERSFRLADVVVPQLRELSRASGETASYYVASEGQRLCLFRIQPNEGMHDQLTAGSLLPFDGSATGQIFHVWVVGDGRIALPEDLPTHSSGLYHQFVTSWSVPVFGDQDAFAGALTLSGLAQRVEPNAVSHRDLLMAHGRILSAALGASPSWCGTVYGEEA
ncbi:IclR family transcriptional regulator [Pigmentiphaga sp. H8]|uniref:IclR family transcriptional regulator n=1 Tax=Pigmentiphaga sp. H8 TaxID=2488560 RepID=UPI000F5B2AA5|nr:helix-turn-helix domain-containing protein [Pigmentiphaga sp. H8]AZG06639.1 IclR family transcriptional regulator [Pigmentiphaga sp. H8]